MFIKRLILKNWQTHNNLTLDFTSGVNIIYGNSDAGKSCIRRAIAWIFGLESYSENDIRKEDTKFTSVTVILDNDVEIERIKSSSINRYITRVPGQKEISYDSIGKVAPQEVQDLLQVHNIEIDKDIKLNLNIAKQVDLPFLYNEQWSATSRLKLFDKLTGNDLLDKMQQDFNKEILSLSKELKNVKQIIEVNTPQVEKLTEEISKKDIIRKEVGERLKNINKEIVRYTKIKELQGYLQNNLATLNNTIANLLKIKDVESGAIELLKNRINALNNLKELNTSFLEHKTQKEQITTQIKGIKTPELKGEALRVIIKRIESLNTLQKGLEDTKIALNAVKGELSGIKATEVDGASIRAKIDRIKGLNTICKGLNDLMVKNQQIINERHLIESSLPAKEKEYNEILKEAKICPLCKQDTSKCEAHL